MSRVLIVCYSFTGTGRRLSQTLSATQGWPIAEVSDAKPDRGIWRCVLDALFHRHPPIRYSGPDWRAFDALVLVAPIWMYRLAGPMRTFVASLPDKSPDVALISLMGSRGAPNAVAEVGRALGRSPLMSTAVLAREVEDGSCAGQVQAFGRALAEAEDSKLVLRPASWSPATA